MSYNYIAAKLISMVFARQTKQASTFGTKVWGFFSSIGNNIKKAVSWAADKVSAVVGTVHNDVANAVSAVHRDIRDTASGAVAYAGKTQDNLTGIINNTVNKTADLGKNVGDNFSKTAGALSLPMAIGGAAALAFILLK
jgi:phage-related protein